jgi:hypothetical protein
MRSRFLLTLLASQKVGPPGRGLTAEASREQGFSLAVVLVSMLAVLVSSVALANRTQTGLVTASVSGSNREAREVADAGITYVISEWNRPENRGMFNALQPMTAWNTNNKALRNPCNDDLIPTPSGTSQFTQVVSLDNSRQFRVTEVTYRNSDNSKSFSTQPNINDSPVGIQPIDTEQVDITVEGSYRRGNTTATALATKRITLATTFECDNSESAADSKGVFAFGGSTPGSTPTFNATPTYYFQDGNRIGSQNVEQILCSPIAPNSNTNQCKTESLGTAKVAIKALPLSASEKEKRNPPQIDDVAKAANTTTTAKPIPPSGGGIGGNTTITIRGTTLTAGRTTDSRFCFMHEGAAHCHVSRIDMSGTQQLIIDSSTNPIYLYVDGNISLSGTSDVFHKIGNKDVSACRLPYDGNTCTPNYTNAKEYEEDSFRFQIRGNPASSTSTQTFSFNGVPSANMLYWAPAADLSVKGNADLASALFVNSLSIEGSSRLRLISAPGSFGFNLGETSEKKRTVAGRSIIYSRYF